MKEKYINYINTDIKFDRKDKKGIICLITIVSGMFGFLYEFIFYYFNSGMKQFYYRGGNFLPWINIYAIGALMIYFFVFDNRKKPLKVFIKSSIICGILEFITGYVMYNYFGGFRCWNYNTEILNFGNIGGFVCLRSVIIFGISSLFLIYVIVPLIYIFLDKFDKKLIFKISIILFSVVLIDELYNLIFARLLFLPRASDIYKKLGIHYVKFK